MTDEDMVISLGREVSTAWAASDVGRLDALLGPDYDHVDIHGLKQDRAGFLADAAEPRTVGILQFDDENVTILGNAGVLTSRVLLGDYPAASAIRILQVWVRAPDGWKRRWYQATTEHARTGA